VASRTQPVDAALRALRGGMLTATTTALTIAVHVAAGGGMPNLGLTLLPTLLLAGGGVLLLDRHPSPVTVLAVLGASQLTVHTLMALSDHDADSTSSMIAAHTAATVVLALLVTQVDDLLQHVANMLCAVLPIAPRSLPAWSTTRTWVVDTATTDAVSVSCTRILPRRGPPSCS
jgi:hypothetical protein